MNRVFDNNGSFLSQSVPKKVLRTVKKSFSVDSIDRNTTLYPTNGEFVVYLPRVYENVVSIRLKTGMFPFISIISTTTENIYSGVIHSRSNANNYANDITIQGIQPYFLIGLEGLNKVDECASEADKSSATDNYFAMIPNVFGTGTSNIFYSDKLNSENVCNYYPPISKLDRMKITIKLHGTDDSFMYWTDDGNFLNSPTNRIIDFALQFEIEYLDNGFDDFSSFETRLAH